MEGLALCRCMAYSVRECAFYNVLGFVGAWGATTSGHTRLSFSRWVEWNGKAKTNVLTQAHTHAQKLTLVCPDVVAPHSACVAPGL